MAGEIIRMGDKTSHGGTVLEGSQTDICMGKPIAYIGHKTECPQCKGTYPIVEGVLTSTLYGKGVAVAGMKTACGAVLVAGQFTDIVETASGGGGGGGASAAAAGTAAAAAAAKGVSPAPAALAEDDDPDVEVETFYAITDENGQPLADYKYDLHAEGALHTKAGEYAGGETVKLTGGEETRLVTWLNRDGGLKA